MPPMTSDLLPIFTFTSPTQIHPLHTNTNTYTLRHVPKHTQRSGGLGVALPLVSQIACNEMAKRANMAAAVSLAVENAVGY